MGQTLSTQTLVVMVTVPYLSLHTMPLPLELTEGALVFLQLALQGWYLPLGQELLLLLHNTERGKTFRLHCTFHRSCCHDVVLHTVVHILLWLGYTVDQGS